MSSLRGCKDAIDDFERTYFPPTCAKKGNECCKCGDTGCEGPVSSATGASSSSGYIAPPTAAIVVVGTSSGTAVSTLPEV